MNIKYKGKLGLYLKMPIFMIFCFVVADIIVLVQNRKIGAILTVLTIVYAIFIIIMYAINHMHFKQEVVDFATHYGTVQKEMIAQFNVPYALVGDDGRFLWMNSKLAEIVEKEMNYRKAVNTIFPEITKEKIQKLLKEGGGDVTLEYNERIYRVCIQNLVISEADKEAEIELEENLLGNITAMLFFDETELSQAKKINTDQSLVAAQVHIDNFEEVLETVDEVKRSLLLAVLDRKINKYFLNVDGIVRKLEKDRYFIIFQHQYLSKLEEEKFALLEDVKNTRMGNDKDITISIGIGVNGESYGQNAEFARAAVEIALGRGGSQVVIKDKDQVSYYGLRGKEVEKNTRVKARVKAQALRELMQTHDNVLVMGHGLSDADSLGSAIGIYCAARELGKKTQIVLNTITTTIRPMVETFSVENGYPEKMFITSAQAVEALGEDSLVVVVDTNRPNYVECPELLKKCKNIVVFDHHLQNEEVIENPLLSYIEPYSSSACEMIAEVLQYFSEKVNLQPIEADCLYAGILIDTNNFVTKTGVRTFEAAAYLRRCGAEVTRVRKKLREDMSAYKARAEVVRDAEVYEGAFAISVCKADELESPTIIGAQASNELLNIVGIKASFVLTEFKGKVYVSSRSIDEIDVQKIMERMGGGGHLNVAGAQIPDETIDNVKTQLKDVIAEMMKEGEINI